MTPAELGKVDVLVIGAGNAAANAALSAHEAGASVAMIETAPKEARGGNSAFTGGAFRFTYSSVDDLLQLAPDIADLDLATHRFRQLHRRPVFRRHGAADRIPLRSRTDRGADRQQLRRRPVAAQARCAVSAGARPAGVQGGRQVQVLGRARVPHPGRRPAPRRDAARAAGTASASRCCTTPPRRRCCAAMHASRACASATGSGNTICAPARWCWRAAASNRMPRCARAISARTGTSRRCAARKYNTGIGHRMAIDIGAAVAGHWSGAHMPCSGT